MNPGCPILVAPLLEREGCGGEESPPSDLDSPADLLTSQLRSVAAPSQHVNPIPPPQPHPNQQASRTSCRKQNDFLVANETTHRSLEFEIIADPTDCGPSGIPVSSVVKILRPPPSAGIVSTIAAFACISLSALFPIICVVRDHECRIHNHECRTRHHERSALAPTR